MKTVEVFKTIKVQGHELEMYGCIAEPLFLALDVAKMIDYSVGNTSHMLAFLQPEEDKMLRSTRSPYISLRDSRSSNTSTRSGNPNKWFLTEFGLYEVLMQSRKPIARRFKSSVKNILKDLRLKNEGSLEDWMNGPDPLVDEWEEHCYMLEQAGDRGYDISFEDYLKKYKGYTDDMI